MLNTIQAKICIIIYGNIASGKTTIANELQKLVNGFEYLSIDKFRLQYAESSPALNAMEREKKCEQEIEDAIKVLNFIIYETTAASTFFKRIKSFLISNGFKLYFVFVECSITVCLQRYEQRLKMGYRFVLPPYKNKPIKELMDYIKKVNYDIDADIELNSEKVSAHDGVEQILLVLKH